MFDWLLNLFRKERTCFTCKKTFKGKGAVIRYTSDECTEENPYHEAPLCEECHQVFEYVRKNYVEKPL
jgi:hypothetical protein